MKEAVEQAIDHCIQENERKSYLMKKKAEVRLMLLTEFNQKALAKVIREDGIKDGIEDGIEEGFEKGTNCLNQLNAFSKSSFT